MFVCVAGGRKFGVSTGDGYDELSAGDVAGLRNAFSCAVASIPGGEGEGGDCPPPNKNIPGREYLFAPSKF